jgi:hypothetical protein
MVYAPNQIVFYDGGWGFSPYGGEETPIQGFDLKGTGKGNVHPRAGHESPEGE